MQIQPIRSYPQASPCSAETFEKVAELASIHTGPDKPMSQLIHDPVQHRSQRAYYVPGQRQDLDVVYQLGHIIDDHFKSGVKDMSTGNQGDILGNMGELLDEGQNVGINMNHANIPDTGAAYGRLYTALRENNHDFTTAIFGSVTLAHMGYEFTKGHPMPVTQALSVITDNIFLTFPTSRRMVESGLGSDPEELETIKSHNTFVKSLFSQLLEKSGVLWIVLDNATHDEEKDGETRLNQVKPGTADLFMADTHTVGMVVGRGEDDILKAQLLDKPAKLTDHAQVHGMNHEKAVALNRLFPDKNFIYDGPKGF